MKRKFILMAVCLSMGMAHAQWRVTSVDKADSPWFSLLQVLQTDKATLLYGTFERDVDDERTMWFNRNLAVYKDGMRYKALNSVNFPIYDEAETRKVWLTKGHNKINFVMEFEKFPVENGFDIVENETAHDNSVMNIYGIKVSKIDSTQVIDTKRFLYSYAPTIKGKYAKNGLNFTYFIHNDVMVTCGGNWNGKDIVCDVDIVNNSDHGVKYSSENTRIIGHKKNKQGIDEETALPKYSADSYDEYYCQRDYENARYQVAGAETDIVRSLQSASYRTPYDSWGRVGLNALSALTRQAANNKIQAYLKEHPSNRPKALRDQSIKAGESLYGYVAFRSKKKYDYFDLIITMDGFDFVFPWNNK